MSERAAGCLQALVTGCADTRAALLGTNGALPALVRCLGAAASPVRAQPYTPPYHTPAGRIPGPQRQSSAARGLHSCTALLEGAPRHLPGRLCGPLGCGAGPPPACAAAATRLRRARGRQALAERAAAVVASLSAGEAALQPLREANAVPPLIALLAAGAPRRAAPPLPTASTETLACAQSWLV